MALARYVLTGGTSAYIPVIGRVDVGEVFEYDEEKYGKPPRFSRKLEPAEETPPEAVPSPGQPSQTLSEMQLGSKTVVRQSDNEPV